MIHRIRDILTAEDSARYQSWVDFCEKQLGQDQPTLITKHIDSARQRGYAGISIECFNEQDWKQCKLIAKTYADSIGWLNMVLNGSWMK